MTPEHSVEAADSSVAKATEAPYNARILLQKTVLMVIIIALIARDFAGKNVPHAKSDLMRTDERASDYHGENVGAASVRPRRLRQLVLTAFCFTPHL